MKKEGINFREALVMLAEKAGVELPENRAPAAKPGSPDDKQTLYAAMQWAERLYHDCLLRAPEAEPARKYLADRGLSKDSIIKYKVGFAPDQWSWLQDRAKSTAFSVPILEACGLVGKSERGTVYDRFKGRAIFPIRDVQSRCIALGGRVLPGNTDPRAAKYVNSPETRLYSKSEQLYGLDVARDAIARQRRVLVMEGYTDVIMAQQHGVGTAVAVCGTALGPRHVRLLQRFADTVVLVLDGDEAGQKRTNEVLELFVAQQMDLRIMTLPDELDPCDFLIARGLEQFEQVAAASRDALDHKMRVALAGINVAVDLHRASEALEEILQTIAKASRLETATASEMRLREQQIIVKLARQFGIQELEIRKRLGDLRKNQKAAAAGGSAPDAPEKKSYGSATKIDPWERELLEVLLIQPEAVPAICEQIAATEIVSEPARKIFELYSHYAHRGIDCDFDRVLGDLPDGALQSFLIEVDELSQARGGNEQADRAPELRVRDLIAKFDHRRREREDRERISRMRIDGAGQADADHQALELLLEEQRRRREEIAAVRKEEVKRK
jgi:DNA primase